MIDPNSASLAREARSSIEVSRDAKGVYRWDIKLYFDAEAGAEDVVLSRLRRVDADLKTIFLPKGDSE